MNASERERQGATSGYKVNAIPELAAVTPDVIGRGTFSSVTAKRIAEFSPRGQSFHR